MLRKYLGSLLVIVHFLALDICAAQQVSPDAQQSYVRQPKPVSGDSSTASDLTTTADTQFSPPSSDSPVYVITLYFAALAPGVIAFLLFLHLHRKGIPGEKKWPLIPALMLGALMLFPPIWLSTTLYDRWSESCFKPQITNIDRESGAVLEDGEKVDYPQPNSKVLGDFSCVDAQNTNVALGLGYLVEWFKRAAGGTTKAMHPWELISLTWLFLSAWGLGIYFVLVRIRRLFVR